MELQIQENFVAPGLDLPDNLGTLGIVQLHADFHKGFFTGKPSRKARVSSRLPKSQATITSLPMVCTSYDFFQAFYVVLLHHLGQLPDDGLADKGIGQIAAPTSTAVAPASISSITSRAQVTPPMPTMGMDTAS